MLDIRLNILQAAIWPLHVERFVHGYAPVGPTKPPNATFNIKIIEISLLPFR